MAGGGALCEEAVADALHFSANQKFSCNLHPHPLIEGNNSFIVESAPQNSTEKK
jgi:hypothetical protein